jgi:FkbM family methyltransferase
MGLARTLVERLSRGRVIGRKMVVAGKSIPIFVTPDAQLKYLKFGAGAFDKDLIKLAEKHVSEDSHVWDIGGNVGTFTFAAASMARRGSVVSVEADIWLASLIRRTARLPEYQQIDVAVLPVAISNACSVASFMVATRGRASNALEVAGGHSQMGGVRERQHVPTLTLDTLLGSFPSPNFVKIDIEGAELMALRGATRLINEIRPTFYVEVSQALSTEIFSLFRVAGYAAYGPDGGLLTDGCAPNTLFVPQS